MGGIRWSSGGPGNLLEIGIEPGLPLLLADRWSMVQVLLNPLANAARHSPEASFIRVSATRKDAIVAVSVTYTGLGHPRGEPAPPAPQVLPGPVRGMTPG